MTKITIESVAAFLDGQNYKSGNTRVDASGLVIDLFLHENLIAKKHPNKQIEITNAGWFSNTTKERLNGILSHFMADIKQKDGNWYLTKWFTDGSAEVIKWDGEWITI